MTASVFRMRTRLVNLQASRNDIRDIVNPIFEFVSEMASGGNKYSTCDEAVWALKESKVVLARLFELRTGKVVKPTAIRNLVLKAITVAGEYTICFDEILPPIEDVVQVLPYEVKIVSKDEKAFMEKILKAEIEASPGKTRSVIMKQITDKLALL